MEIILVVSTTALVLLAVVANHHTPHHRQGPSVAEIQARLAAEQRTFVPLRGW